jgi:uncharacterized SAM-binding protein YcdF (DUF218 family)
MGLEETDLLGKNALTADEAVEAAHLIFNYLYLCDRPVGSGDLIIGFGHFDPKIPRRCCDLYEKGLAPWILFTGGMGSGTADLGRPEALFFRDEAGRYMPQIPAQAILVESESANTSENLLFTLESLSRRRPLIRPGRELHCALLVASAYRQRRVWLTCRKAAPQVTFVNAPPVTTFDDEIALFRVKGLSFPKLLLGEIDRIRMYGIAGYIQSETIPRPVEEACRQLAFLLGTEHV